MRIKRPLERTKEEEARAMARERLFLEQLARLPLWPSVQAIRDRVQARQAEAKQEEPQP